ncbi:RidA family protein [Dysgonomonas sp. ZJ709]|uniref:RidA family protein n=1 Tax=Dysgonomonas sp. ZJ709 TaxID=2709797 RepID=UPI0013ED20AE|nr:RidA family protein [Dysgonomonas sp. ZJ709]
MRKISTLFLLFTSIIGALYAQETIITKSQTAKKMQESGIVLPHAPAPVGSYVPYKRVGNLIFINQVSLVDGKILTPGVIGEGVTEEQAKQATRQAMLNVVAILNQAVGGDLDRVKQAVQMTGIFNTSKGYTQHAVLMNEGSSLLIDIFGERGVHTRATFGASSLPINSPVEIQAIFEVE